MVWKKVFLVKDVLLCSSSTKKNIPCPPKIGIKSLHVGSTIKGFGGIALVCMRELKDKVFLVC